MRVRKQKKAVSENAWKKWLPIGLIVLLIVLIAVASFQFSKDSPTEEKNSVGEDEIYAAASEEYEKAMMKKVSARIQQGWFTPNESAIISVDPPPTVNDFPKLVKDLSSVSWPAKSSILLHHELFPIFRWDLTQFSSDSSKSKSKYSGSKDRYTLPQCRFQIDPVFVLGSERDKGGMVGSKHDQAVMYANVSMAEFLQGTFREKMYLYWTGELEYFETSFGLKSSIPSESQKLQKLTRWEDFHIAEPNLELLDEEDGDELDSSSTDIHGGNQTTTTTTDDTLSTPQASKSKSKSKVRPMIWLSHPGVVAQTHYDPQHNIFLQVQGFKRFHLFPPAAELYVYPNIHHSYRQSQIHFEKERHNDSHTMDVFELVNATTVEAIEVTLGPGDILYIPPFWQHRVESLTLSLSVSILSPSEIDAAIAELFWLQVPFGGDLQKTRSLRIRSVLAYMDALFGELGTDLQSSLPESANDTTGFSSPSQSLRHRFAQSLFHSRFAPLLREVPLSKTPRLCPLGSADDVDAASADQIREERQLIHDSQGNFKEAAVHFVATMQQLQTEDAIKRTFLRDYLEQLVRWAVGPQLTGETILKCF